MIVISSNGRTAIDACRIYCNEHSRTIGGRSVWAVCAREKHGGGDIALSIHSDEEHATSEVLRLVHECGRAGHAVSHDDLRVENASAYL